MAGEVKSQNISWHSGQVTVGDRERLLKQRGCTIWLTGLSGSGKSTIAVEAEKQLVTSGHAAYVLDGDNVRQGLNKDLGFSPQDRTENIRRIAEVAKLMTDAGLIVLTAFISPYRADREAAREIFTDGEFFEAYVDTSLEICEARDPKGLYVKARSGDIPEFTGISAPYEVPKDPELIVKTENLVVDESAEQLLSFIRSCGFLAG